MFDDKVYSGNHTWLTNTQPSPSVLCDLETQRSLWQHALHRCRDHRKRFLRWHLQSKTRITLTRLLFRCLINTLLPIIINTSNKIVLCFAKKKKNTNRKWFTCTFIYVAYYIMAKLYHLKENRNCDKFNKMKFNHGFRIRCYNTLSHHSIPLGEWDWDEKRARLPDVSVFESGRHAYENKG